MLNTELKQSVNSDFVGAGSLSEAIDDWEISLGARNMSPKTLEAYLAAANQLNGFVESSGMPSDIAYVRREHIELFLSSLVRLGRKPATVHSRYRALRTFFVWLTETAYAIDSNPMKRIEPPILPESPVSLLQEDDISRLLRKLDRDKSFKGVRDNALVLFLLDTGARRSEVCGLRFTPDKSDTNDIIDLRRGLVRLLGKGRKERIVHIGNRTADAFARYRRARARQRLAYRPEFWLTAKGGLLPNSLYQIVRDRGKEVGLSGLRPHKLRHQFAHQFLVAGGRESDLMALAGWESSAMVRRYAKSAQQERAIEAHSKLSFVDRL
jgi:site-specific recombinase XerD